MKNKLQIILLLMFCGLVCGAFSTDTKKFFNTGGDPASKLPAGKNYPKGQLFPLFCSSKKNKNPKMLEISKLKGKFRCDVYCALIGGAKKILVFSADKKNKDYLRINREVNGKLKLGRVFLFGKAKSDISLKIIDGPEKINNKYPSVLMANIAYKNSRYIFLVNSSSQTVELIVGGLVYGSGVTVQDIFLAEDKFTAPEGDFEVEIKSLEVKAFKIYNRINH